MLLKRIEENGKLKATYSSSNICASIYEKDKKELTVIFNNGGQYKYLDVSLSNYTRFELADSQGVVHNTHIKSHKFESLPKVDAAVLLAEVTKLKDDEDKKRLEDATIIMIHKLKALIASYESPMIGGGISDSQVEKAEEAIKTYRSARAAKAVKI